MCHQCPSKRNGSHRTHDNNVLRGVQLKARDEIPTRTKVRSTKWNPEKERPIGGFRGLEPAEVKDIIEKLATVKATIETEYNTFVNKFQSHPDKSLFKEQFTQSLSGPKRKASDPSQSFLSLFDR